MATKVNKYVHEVKLLITMIQDGLMDINARPNLIEKVNEYYKQKKINKNDHELLLRALGENK